MSSVQTLTVHAADGRRVCVESIGEGPKGAVLVCAGTPNSRHLYRPWVQDAEHRGLRIIGYDRPGYGGSAPQSGRSVADAAADVRAIAEALELERLLVWGFSGGGPHAAACA